MTTLLEHMVFSTRALKASSGTELSREVIAWSDGISPEMRAAFGVRADITGSVLRQREAPEVHTFSKVGDVWLLCRAVSLGLYRKGSHQLLVHGVVLRREHVDAVQGNPFLLADPETGLPFDDEHPGSRRRLEGLTLDRGIAEAAREQNLKRLEELCRRFSHLDDGFPALFDRLRKGRRTAFLTPEAPDRRWVEWLLLHLHPDDRAEVSFHTWYTHNRAIDYQLVMGLEEDRGLLRQQFPELVFWPEGEPSVRGLGALTGELRRSSPVRFAERLERYRLTYRADRAFPPLDDDEARLCLSEGLGRDLSPEDEEALRRLRHRGGDFLAYHVHDLAWRYQVRGTAELVSRLEALAAKPPEHLGDDEPEKVLATLRHDDYPARWTLAVAVRTFYDHRGDEFLRGFWQRLFPPESFPQLLAFLGSSKELVDHATPHLISFVAKMARQEALTSEREDGTLYWESLLRWLAVYGSEAGLLVRRVEEIVDEAPERVAVDWLRRLQEIGFALGFRGLSYRLIFQKEVARLPAEVREGRIGEAVLRFLDDPQSPAEVLRSPFGDSPTARAMLAAMAAWIHAHPEPEAAWERWRDLFDAQAGAMSPEVKACGNFLSTLAISPVAPHISDALALLCQGLPEDSAPAPSFRDAVLRDAVQRLIPLAKGPEDVRFSPHLAQGVAGLVAARRSPADEELDERLLKLLFYTVIHVDHVAGGFLSASTALRRMLAHYLAVLLSEGRLERLAGIRGPWDELLLDEMLREPPRVAEQDPRYRAFLRLTWSRWSEDRPVSAEQARGHEFRIRRMLCWTGIRLPTVRWQVDLMREVVVLEDLRRSAERFLRAA